MDSQHSQSLNLSVRLRGARVDERLAEVLVVAVAEELGLDRLHDGDGAAARRLAELIEAAARRTGTSAVNKFVLEFLELLDEAPDLRDHLARVPPEPATS